MHFSFSKLPTPLPQLMYLTIVNRQMTAEPSSAIQLTYPQLGHLALNDNNLNDGDAQFIINSVLTSSYGSLLVLQLQGNQLTRVPAYVPGCFVYLNTLDLSNNQIKTLPIGSLAFLSTVRAISVYLNTTGLHTIAPGAFQGNFKRSYIFLDGNSLGSLDRDIFQPILQDMIQSKRGMISIGDQSMSIQPR